MPAEQLRHFGFKTIMTLMGLGALFHLRDLNYGQELQLKYHRETNKLLEERLATQSTPARLR
jgi:hypothetical protein